MTTRIGAKCQ